MSFPTKQRLDTLEANLPVALDLSDLTATAAELNRVADVSTRLVTVTDATLAVDVATHEGKTVVLSKVNGQTVTMPAATGSGARYRFVIGLSITSVGTIFNVTGNDLIHGLALGLDGDGVPANAWAPTSGNNKITLDGSTQGGLIGDVVEFEDIAADKWAVQLRLQQSGTEATPFSTAA